MRKFTVLRQRIIIEEAVFEAASTEQAKKYAERKASYPGGKVDWVATEENDFVLTVAEVR